MDKAKRSRGRPATMERRKALARALLLGLIREELLVANGGTRRGKSWMVHSLAYVQRQVAREAGVSLSWVQKAWQQCQRDAKQGIANEVCAARQAKGEREYRQWVRARHLEAFGAIGLPSDAQIAAARHAPERWAAERAVVDAVWAVRLAQATPRRTRRKHRT